MAIMLADTNTVVLFVRMLFFIAYIILCSKNDWFEARCLFLTFYNTNRMLGHGKGKRVERTEIFLCPHVTKIAFLGEDCIYIL